MEVEVDSDEPLDVVDSAEGEEERCEAVDDMAGIEIEVLVGTAEKKFGRFFDSAERKVMTCAEGGGYVNALWATTLAGMGS